MTIRDALHQMLAGLGSETDPAQVLADNGYPDIPPESFAQVLGHFSDTAPIELADSLAPITTRVSNVPFEADELPEISPDLELDNPVDIYETLSKVGLESFGTVGLFDNSDPEMFDEADAILGRPVDVGEGKTTKNAQHDEDTDDVSFGLGDHDEQFLEDTTLQDVDGSSSRLLIDRFDEADASEARTELDVDDLINEHEQEVLDMQDDSTYDEAEPYDPFASLGGDDPADLDFD